MNPHAAAFARDLGLCRAVAEQATGGAPVRTTESVQELDQVASEILAAGAERVVLCGGDGTYMAGVSALARAAGAGPLPEVVLAPAGTVATVARNLGQRAGLLETVRRATGPTPRGELVRSPTLRVQGGSEPERIGFIFGTGLVARFFERYYSGSRLGYRAALGIVLRVFAGSFFSDSYSRSVLDPLPCRVSIDGQSLSSEAFSLVLCSVVRDVGLHLWVPHRAAEDPERPHLVASSLSPRRLGPQAPRVFLGRGLRDADGFDGLVNEFRVEFPGDGPYVLDGDLLHAREVSVRAGPMISVRTYP